jgi:hypothetical protein
MNAISRKKLVDTQNYDPSGYITDADNLHMRRTLMGASM